MASDGILTGLLIVFTVLGTFSPSYLIIRSAFPPFRRQSRRVKLTTSLGVGLLMGLVFASPVLFGQGLGVFFLFMSVSFLALWGVAALAGRIVAPPVPVQQSATSFIAEAAYSHAALSTDDRLKVGAMKSVLEHTAKIEHLKEELEAVSRRGQEETAKELAKQLSAAEHSLKESRTILRQIEKREQMAKAARSRAEEEERKRQAEAVEQDMQQLVKAAEQEEETGESMAAETRTGPEKKEGQGKQGKAQPEKKKMQMPGESREKMPGVLPAQGEMPESTGKKKTEVDWDWMTRKTETRAAAQPETGKGKEKPAEMDVESKSVSLEEERGKGEGEERKMTLEELDKEWREKDRKEDARKAEAEKAYKELESVMLGEEEKDVKKRKDTEKA